MPQDDETFSAMLSKAADEHWFVQVEAREDGEKTSYWGVFDDFDDAHLMIRTKPSDVVLSIPLDAIIRFSLHKPRPAEATPELRGATVQTFPGARILSPADEAELARNIADHPAGKRRPKP